MTRKLSLLALAHMLSLAPYAVAASGTAVGGASGLPANATSAPADLRSSLPVSGTASASDAGAGNTADATASVYAGGIGTVVSPPITRSFSLSACFDQADRYNKEIMSGRWALPIAAAAVKASAAVPNPQFQLQTGFGDSFTFLFTGQTQQYAFVEQFQTAGKRSKKIALARAGLGLAELQFDALRFDVHNRVRRAYAELAAAEAYEALVESQRQVALNLVQIAQKRFEAGKAPKSEALQAALNVMQLDTQRNQAQGRLQKASAALALISGERPRHPEVIDVDDNGIFKLSAEKTEIVPSPTRELPALTDLLNTAYATRNDLKAAQQQVYVYQKALALAKTKKIPDLFLGAGGTYSTFAKHQPANLPNEPNWLGTGAFFTVTAENPVLYQYQGEVQLATRNVLQARKQFELQKAQVSVDVITALNEVSVARANIFEFQKNLLPTAAQVSHLAYRSYQVGAADLSTAIVGLQQYQQTLSNYFDAVVAYQTAWADMEKAVGAPLQK